MKPVVMAAIFGAFGAACATGATDSEDAAASESGTDTSGNATATGAGGMGASSSGSGGVTASGTSSTSAGTSSSGTSSSATSSAATTSAATTSAATTSTSGSASASASGSSSTGGGMDGCGNGKLEAGEECDLGMMNADSGACTLGCKKAVCGDGLLQKGVEGCDDANLVDGDGCNVGCVVSGTPAWTVTYDQLDESFYGVAIDSAGNAIVVGETVGAFDLDIVVRKYDTNGKLVWTKTFDSGTNDSANAVAVDAQDNLFVVGSQEDFDGSKDIVVRKLSSAGAALWTELYNAGVDGSDDVALGVAVDAKGDAVLAAGVTADLFEGIDIGVAKISGATGSVVWADVVSGTSGANDVANSVHIDASGAIVVTGSIIDATKNDVWIRKYTDNGATPTVVWTKQLNGAANGDDYGFGIATDAKGNVLVSGAEYTAAQSYNAWVGKLDANGTAVWTKSYNGKANLVDAAGSVAVNANGDVVVGGYEQLADTTLDVWVRKFNANGDIVWTQTYGGKANGDDAVFAVAFDAKGFAYGAGQETAAATGIDGWLRKYAP